MPQPISASLIPAQAFVFLQLAPLSSFADDSAEAADAARVYPQALRMVLELAEWSFASRIVQINEAELDGTEQPDPDLPHAYVLPDDCVSLRQIYGLDVAWRLDEPYLRCTEPGPLRIRYTRLITNEARLPATVQTCVALQMATLLAGKYLTTRTKIADLKNDLAEAVSRALRNDGRNASPQSAYDEDHGWWDREAVR